MKNSNDTIILLVCWLMVLILDIIFLSIPNIKLVIYLFPAVVTAMIILITVLKFKEMKRQILSLGFLSAVFLILFNMGFLLVEFHSATPTQFNKAVQLVIIGIVLFGYTAYKLSKKNI